jgi:perosamine synthetase
MEQTFQSKPPVRMASADITEADIESVSEVVRSGQLTMGPKTEEFERLVASYCGANHAIAVNSGTSGLHLLAIAAGLGHGDEVITTSFSFVASTNCFLYCGATPVFVDIDPQTYCINPALIRPAISKQTKAIVAVDVFGHPADWGPILRIAAENGLAVIADACESLGAEYHGNKTGPFGLGGVFAYFPNKQMTTGEGGVIVTNDSDVARRCRSLRNQGREEAQPWLEHACLGYNYRMTEMSAALGVSQLQRLDLLLEKRHRVAAMYDSLFADEPLIRTLKAQPYAKLSYFVYIVELKAGINRLDVMQKLASRGIPSRGYFSPIHRQPYVARLLSKPCFLPETERVGEKTIALPFHNNLTDDEISYVADALKAIVRETA